MRIKSAVGYSGIARLGLARYRHRTRTDYSLFKRKDALTSSGGGGCHADGELEESAIIRNFRIVQTEGLRQVTRDTKHYNLQMIIAIGYKEKSSRQKISGCCLLIH